MEKDGTYSDSKVSPTAIELGVALAEITSAARAVLENLGIVKVQELGEKKPEGGKFWESIKNAHKEMVAKLDRLAGIEPKDSGKNMTRAVFVAVTAIPIAIVAFTVWSHANEIKQGIENKKQEKTAPAPRKATGREMHKNDVFYTMAFGKQLPKKTFVVAQKPISRARQLIG